MKFAIVDELKVESSPGLKGTCPFCKSDVIAKCGDKMTWHWAHKSKKECDHWWENETEWHREWKNLFPVEWQEVVHFDESGEKHIADVKTHLKWVLEFQHSNLKNEEKVKRSEFYGKIVWIVDGTRRKTDPKQFNTALQEGYRIPAPQVHAFQISIEKNRLLKEWTSLKKPFFIDFKIPGQVWMIFPTKSPVNVYAIAFSKDNFVQLHNERGQIDEFGKFINEFPSLITSFLSRRR